MLLAAPTHMTADQLLAALKQSPSRVSKATVYNTLKLFVDHGLARQIHTDPDRCVYDSSMAPHHHFQNVETGEMVDILPRDLELARLPPLPPETEILIGEADDGLRSAPGRARPASARRG